MALVAQTNHDTICNWRNANEQAISRCFVEVLKLARELKWLKLGTIAIDGTHIRANASKDKNLTYERAVLLDMREKLRTQAGKEIYSKRQQSAKRVEARVPGLQLQRPFQLKKAGLSGLPAWQLMVKEDYPGR